MINSSGEVNMEQKNILLAILPYWSPVIPPVGLSSLKSYLTLHGYHVKNIDFNTKTESIHFYYEYLDRLMKYIPEEKRGTFKNLVHDILEDHLIAYIKYRENKNSNEELYNELVKYIIYNTFYVEVDDILIKELDQLIETYLQVITEYFVFKLDYEKTDVFGLTLYKTNLAFSLFVLKLIKDKFPWIKTVVGGGVFVDTLKLGTPNFDTFLSETKLYIDKIIIGEGEELLLKYLNGEFPEDKRYLTREDLTDDEKIPMDSKPVPDLSDFNLFKYNNLAANASIGCIYNCTFCNEASFYGKYKTKSIQKIYTDMLTLYNQYKVNLFFMTDSLLNPVIDDITKEFISKKAPFYFDTYFRIDKNTENQEKVFSWRMGGLYRVRLGIESGSEKMLKIMNKYYSIDRIKNNLINLSKAGIKTTTYWVIGHPYETEEDFMKTLDLLDEMKNFIWQAECNPFRYYIGANNSDDEWQNARKEFYPEKYCDIMPYKTYTLDIEPNREIIYDRVSRFINHCKKIGIPNPYSAYEIFEADKRWKILHSNSVPTTVELQKESIIDSVKGNITKIIV